MAKVKTIPRKCATCRFWTGNPRSPYSARCEYKIPGVEFPPLPESVTFGIEGHGLPPWPPRTGFTERSDGAKCPVWEWKAAE